MSAVATALICERCGVQDGAVGNWKDGDWVSLAKLFQEPKLVLPVPVRYVQVREIDGRELCQRCASGDATK